MELTRIFQTYFFYLIHPFRSHQLLKEQAESGSEEADVPQALGIYESLGTSWVFVVIAGLMRILMINGLILIFMGVMDPATDFLTHFYDGDKFTGFYFLVLSSILDVIFYPLITLFVIQFWEFVLKSFAFLAGVEGDVGEKSKTILSVALSSHILLIIPIFGEMAQKAAHFTQMYAGIREQLGFSRALTICVLLTPVLILLFVISFFVFLFAL